MIIGYMKLKLDFYLIDIRFLIQIYILKQITKFSLKNINQKKIFENLNEKFSKGEIIGILGESGKGKSTLINLISGLLILDKGVILVDGKNIFSDIYSWRLNISYIPQNIYLIDDTLKNNIAFFNNLEIDEYKYKKALEDAQIVEFVNDLKKKDEEIVGERGSKISGGQMQRIALARALYKGSDVLILDEATNALDEINENKILNILSKLKKNKLIIIISHNKKTLKICDRILSIKNMNLEV